MPDGSPVLLPLTTDQRSFVGRADVALSFDAAQDDGWHGTASITRLSRADFSADQMQISGSGRISRPGGVPVLGATLRFDAQEVMPTDTALATALGQTIDGKTVLYWQPGSGALALSQLVLNGEDYRLTAGGRIEGLEKGFAVTGRMAVQADDLSRASELMGRPLGGTLDMTASGSANLLAGSFDLAAQIAGSDLRMGQAEADNLLRGASQISLSVRRGTDGTEIRKLDITAGSLNARASGRVATAGSTLTADLDFPDLSVLGGPYRGALTGRASFSGTPEAGRVTLEADANGLSVGQAEADRLLRGASHVSLEAGFVGDTVDLHRMRVTAATLDATASGTYRPAGSDLVADLNFTDLSALGARYRGGLVAKAQFTGTDQTGRLTVEGTGRDLGIGQPETDRLMRGQSDLTATLDLQAGRIKIDSATLSNPQLQIDATGTVAAEVQRITLSARLADLGVLLADFPGAATLTGTVEDDVQGYKIDLTGKGPGQIDATVAGRIAPDFRQANLTLAGSAQVGLANAFISPRVVSGPLRFDLRLNGPLALASLAGQVTLAEGRVSDPSLPFALENMRASADLAGGRAQITADAAISTGGRARLSGTVGLAAPYASDLRAELDQIIAKDPRLYQTRVNGTLTVAGPLTGGAVIAGRIRLTETELRIPSTGLGGTGALPDLQHVSEPAAVHATRARAGLIADAASNGTGTSRRPYGLDLTIAAPKRLFIRGRGLDAELGGELRLTGTTDAVVPIGAFNLIRGRLDILGKRLDLSRALLQMEGDFDPFIDILASNESDGIVSSVRIAGKATDPKVSFVSAPELPEEEVLSRLLFGRNLTSLSALQAAQLAGAVATLAGRGGAGVVGKLRKGFGLDDLDLVTGAEGQTTVKAGKYISRKLYTEIEVDQQGQSQINLNLDVSKSLTLRGSTGSEGQTGIGIFLKKDY
ncbi:MAG: translocation/assembly module TamB domain-containing protein [Paracoccaceae bacterium]|nr:translocation/assembly module TamB domain-containing protein [Paracoccaceae bacterium]